jgi:hypothetical protein
MKAIWGPVTYPAGNSNCPSGTKCSAFPTYKQIGADNYEMQVPWDRVALRRPANPRDPNDPAYTWPTYADQAAQQAAQYGMSVTILVQGTPAWANGSKGRQWVPDKMQDYADFMYAASLRYPSVHQWMVWGEVNYGANFQPMPEHSPVEGRFPDIRQPALNNLIGLSDADTLHKLLKKAYVGKKRKGRKSRKATASAHVSKNGKKKKKARRHTPPIWFSEYSVLSGHPAHFWLGFYVSDQEQAQWVSSAYQLVNSVPYVAGLGWYRLDDEPEASGSANWGLVTYTGQHKASFGAYAGAP